MSLGLIELSSGLPGKFLAQATWKSSWLRLFFSCCVSIHY